MKVTVNKTCATVSGAEMLTSGMVGKTIDVEFSADWLGLIKIAVFTNGAVTRDVLDPNGTVIIPWEVLEQPNKRASVGFYGYKIENGEKVRAIPTIWAELGTVRAGADPSGDPSAELSPTVAEQLQSDVNDLDDRVSELEQGGGGGGTTDYNDLENKPKINGVELSGNKTTEQLGIEIPSLDGYATEEWVEGKGYLTEHQSLSAYRTASAQDVIDATKAAASDVSAIQAKIPSATTSANQLADKAFVNSTVGTNTAIFRGTFNSVAELEAYSGEKTNNDYAFVITTDSVGNTVYNRYKYNGTAWVFEYALNNSSFTAAQWAAIQSGITAEDVALIGTAVQPSDLKTFIPHDKTDDLNYRMAIDTNVGIGNVVDIEPHSSTFSSIVVPCKVGDKFVLTGTGGSSPRLWAFTDNEYKLLSISAVNKAETEVELTAAADGYFISNAQYNKEFALTYKELTDKYALKTDLEQLQTKTITDSAGYFTTDTVEGALAEIGAELAGVNTLLGSGVIT